MKKILLLVILVLSCFARADYEWCRVFAKNCVICTSEESPGQMKVYWLKKDGSWVMKMHFFGDENFQSVYARSYKRYDYYETCVNLEIFGILQDRPDYTDSEYGAVKKKCRALCDSVLSEIRSGNKIDIPNFGMGFGPDYEEPFSMHCSFSSYVETRNYNRKGVVTKKKSYEMMPGDHCRRFLANDRIYWKP